MKLDSIPTMVTIVLSLASPGLVADEERHRENIQPGSRPLYLVNDMDNSALKRTLERCQKGPFERTDFSIGHRGAALKFPEHTVESYTAAAAMGAGMLECDVTFTSDRQLVCRHSQCDLHTTTNILNTELAARCSQPFSPATFDADGIMLTAATAQCCTSDITLKEFKSLSGRMNAVNKRATTVAEYMDATTSSYTGKATLMTHRESIRLFRKLGVKMIPELKAPIVSMPYQGDYSQQAYARQMIDEYRQEQIRPSSVWAQSFSIDDVRYWIKNEPEFGMQAVFLDGRYSKPSFDHSDPASWNPTMEELVADGVKTIAPPMWMLLQVNNDGEIVPSLYAQHARAAGLDIITWTLERSGPLNDGGGFYYQTVSDVIGKDGDMMIVLDVLAQDVGITGIFSDWPATVTYYANCMGIQ